MKTLILISIIFLFSCEKEQCKTCYVETLLGEMLMSHPPFKLCGDDLKIADGLVIRDSIWLGGAYRDMSYKINCK